MPEAEIERAAEHVDEARITGGAGYPERVRQARLKVEAYAEYLADERANLERELAAAQRELRAKVGELAAAPARA